MIFYAVMLVIMLPFLGIFAWMVMASLKTQLQNMSIPPLLVFQPTFDNYAKVLSDPVTARMLLNGVIVAGGATGLGLLFGLPAAFSIARFRQHRLALAVLVARIIPGISYLIPWYIIFSRTQLIGSHVVLILVHLTITLPLTIWIMIGFFEDIPTEIQDAALIDGCSLFQVFRRVAVPLTMPGITTAAILSCIFVWNTFIFTLVLGRPATRTAPMLVLNFINDIGVDWGRMTAAAVIITLPVILLALFLQRYVVTGLTMGGVKE
ncbi:MAG: carbohydrate ABC transporter permease [Anaerolineae bacterium]|nr:carbohydrate ABC transporter permease [Anaerolineae bacterium]